MLSNAELLKQFKRNRTQSESDLSPQYGEARENHTFVAGDSMYYSATVEDKGQRKAVVFNKVRPYVDAVVGLMIQMRRKPDYQARLEDSQEQQAYSAWANSFSDYARETSNLPFLESLQDREMLIAGYGAVDTNVGYERNPDGEVMAEVCRFDEVFWDSQAKEPNLIDARWVMRRKSFTKDEVKARFPNIDEGEFEAYTGGLTSKEYYPDGGDYTAIQTGGNSTLDLLQVNYYQWWELKKYWRAENPALEIADPEVKAQFLQVMMAMQENRYNLTEKDEQEDLFKFKADAEYLCMTPEQKSDMDALCAEYGLELKAIQQTKRCYYTALITGTMVIDKFMSQHQGGFTIKFKTGHFDPVTRLWYGMVRSLKNPQEYANKALTEMLYTIASNSKGGVMYETSAVEDVRKFEQQYATTKAAIQVADGALSGGKIQPKAQSALPTGYENIHAIADNAMGEVTGIGREFIGNASGKQVTALLESQRINQVVSTLANYFDAISLYQVEHARLMLTYLRILAENSRGRLIRIVGEDGAAQYQKLSEDQFTDEYDVVVGESPITPAQKERTTEIMIQMAEKVSMLGQNIYPVVVNYLPISMADKLKLTKALTPDPESAQAQAKAAADAQAAEQAMNKVIAEGTIARAERDRADAQLKMVGVDKTIADTARILEDTASIAAQTNALNRAPVTDVRVNL